MKKVFQSLRRNPYQSLAGFLVLFFSLFLSLIIFTGLVSINGFLNYLETKPQIIVYFKPETPEELIFKIRDELSQSGKISSIRYISQKEAFDIYKRANKDNPLLLEMVSADILPPSLEISATKPFFLPEIAEFLKRQSSVDEVQFQKDILDEILKFTNTARRVSLVFFGYLILMAVVVLSTSISLKIALRKEEIEILNLIGASRGYIIKPYLLESVFLGILAASFSFLLFLGLIISINPFLRDYLSGIAELAVEIGTLKLVIWPLNPVFFSYLFLVVIVFGTLIGIVSSLLASVKYFK
ncbi:MAG: permease-like cell division protein FtsX [Patescibacteria group bacterium]|nr:permease-like cell division protein FtsX [Patescibacteria group bacterium]